MKSFVWSLWSVAHPMNDQVKTNRFQGKRFECKH